MKIVSIRQCGCVNLNKMILYQLKYVTVLASLAYENKSKKKKKKYTERENQATKIKGQHIVLIIWLKGRRKKEITTTKMMKKSFSNQDKKAYNNTPKEKDRIYI